MKTHHQPKWKRDESDLLYRKKIRSTPEKSLTTYFSSSRSSTSLLSELAGTPLTREMTCKWLELDPASEETPVDSRIKNLIEGLSEDPEDNPESFIPIIESHNARLHKAHLLHKATVHIIQQKWVEGTNLEDIKKLLQSWAPEPYRNKPMPQGMLQALLGSAPDSQMWTPADLSNCIFRNTEAAASTF